MFYRIYREPWQLFINDEARCGGLTTRWREIYSRTRVIGDNGIEMSLGFLGEVPIEQPFRLVRDGQTAMGSETLWIASNRKGKNAIAPIQNIDVAIVRVTEESSQIKFKTWNFLIYVDLKSQLSDLNSITHIKCQQSSETCHKYIYNIDVISLDTNICNVQWIKSN